MATTYIKTTNKKKCSTDGCSAQTINDKCLKCTSRARSANKPYKQCAADGCENGVRTKKYCAKCDPANKPKMHKCKTDDCTHKTHNEYCAECINRINRVKTRKPLLPRDEKVTKPSITRTVSDAVKETNIDTTKDIKQEQLTPVVALIAQDDMPIAQSPSLVNIVKDNIASASSSRSRSRSSSPITSNGGSKDDSGSDEPMTFDELFDELDLLFIDYGLRRMERAKLLEVIAKAIP